jgi:4'-phosphopantetheinyl transferase
MNTIPPDVDTTIWQPAPVILPSVPENTVHIWLIRQRQTQIVMGTMLGYLHEDEKRHATTYRTADLRSRYIVRQAALRRILSRYIGLAPVTIEFEYGEWDKPCLVGSKLQFNLSHSESFAVVGVSQSQPLGIDIEAVESLPDMVEVAQHHFSPAEQTDLFSLPVDRQLEGFYKCWTRKEAYIKADGRGLGIALDSFDVTLDGTPKIRRIDQNHDTSDWTLLDLPVPDGYCGALATRQSIHQILTWLF